MESFRDYLGLSNSCSYDVDDVIGRADRFGFQNFCSPGYCFVDNTVGAVWRFLLCRQHWRQYDSFCFVGKTVGIMIVSVL